MSGENTCQEERTVKLMLWEYFVREWQIILWNFELNFYTMHKPLLILCCFVAMLFTKWEPDFITATQRAKQNHQLILLNFSGSDWCGPCIRMRNEIFESQGFSKMADTSIIMVNADFPRNKKNQLSKPVVKQNEMLADKYNPNGLFPYTVLITAEGKVIKAWDGLPKENAEQFTTEVKTICDANK